MSLNELRDQAHKTAVEHGWWDNPPSFPEVIALCHSELSEALEEYRSGNKIRPGAPTPKVYYSGKGYVADKETLACKKPEGLAVELADCIIRILDYCGHDGIDIDGIVRTKMAYNETRPYKHGGKVI